MCVSVCVCIHVCIRNCINCQFPWSCRLCMPLNTLWLLTVRHLNHLLHPPSSPPFSLFSLVLSFLCCFLNAFSSAPIRDGERAAHNFTIRRWQFVVIANRFRVLLLGPSAVKWFPLRPLYLFLSHSLSLSVCLPPAGAGNIELIIASL